MKTPFCIRLQILGLQPNDEVEYFENPEAFVQSQRLFPLNQNGQLLGINLNRLEYFIKKNYLQEGKLVRWKLIYTFYNYITQQFVDLFDLLCIDNNFIKLDGQFWFKDENSTSPLIIKLKVQIYYQEYLNFQHFLENIELEKKNLYNNIEKAKTELNINNENLINFKMRVNQLKQCYQIQSQYPEIDIAILYSHPLVNQEEKRVNPVQYYDDISNFKKKISALNKKVSYLITQATKENLKWVLKYNPKIIHIIAHGVNDTNKLNQYLQFENNCTDDFVYREDLQQIMKDSKKSLLFLACCYAGEIAKNIQQYATTIAIDKELKMLDDAGIYYFQALYENLLQNKTLQESHEEAKKNVEFLLGEKNYQCCHSHSHREACKKIFVQNSDLCFKHLTFCKCEESNLIKDKLSHLWGSDEKEQCSQVCEAILKELKDQSQIKNVKKKLDELAVDGILRVCCCELAEKFIYDDNLSFIQHTESEKFQIFSQTSNQSQVFNNVENGTLMEINKVSWEEQYFIAWKKDARIIFQKLSESFFQQKRQIIKICAGNSKGEQFLIKFAHQIAKYFKFRKLKFYKRNEFDDIQIEQDLLENIEQLLKKQLQQRICYIFIIHQINKEILLKRQEQLRQLNQKGIVMLISNQELFQLELDSNYFKIVLKDWQNSDKKEKCDYFKIISEYGEEIQKKIVESIQESKLKNLKFNELIDEIEIILKQYPDQIAQI